MFSYLNQKLFTKSKILSFQQDLFSCFLYQPQNEITVSYTVGTGSYLKMSVTYFQTLAILLIKAAKFYF